MQERIEVLYFLDYTLYLSGRCRLETVLKTGGLFIFAMQWLLNYSCLSHKIAYSSAYRYEKATAISEQLTHTHIDSFEVLQYTYIVRLLSRCTSARLHTTVIANRH